MAVLVGKRQLFMEAAAVVLPIIIPQAAPVMSVLVLVQLVVSMAVVLLDQEPTVLGVQVLFTKASLHLDQDMVGAVGAAVVTVLLYGVLAVLVAKGTLKYFVFKNLGDLGPITPLTSD
jgi:hypothetical protein